MRVASLVERDEDLELVGIQFDESTELLREMLGVVDAELGKKVTVGTDFRVGGRPVRVVRARELTRKAVLAMGVDVAVNCTHRPLNVDLEGATRVVGLTPRELLLSYSKAAEELVRMAKEG